jgi:hypothetical protein
MHLVYFQSTLLNTVSCFDFDMQLLKSPVVEAATKLHEDYIFATISADLTFSDNLSSSHFSLSQGNCTAEFQLHKNFDSVEGSKPTLEFWRLPSIATWFCRAKIVNENKESPCCCVLGSTVFESGYQYFEISAQYASGCSPPAIGIVDADSESFGSDEFSGVAITILGINRSLQLSGSFASQGSTVAARSGLAKSALGIPSSDSSITARASFFCLPSLDNDIDLFDSVDLTRTRLLAFCWI